VKIAALALILSLPFLAGCERAPDRYDHAVIGVPDGLFEAVTDGLGEAGWEIVSTRRAVSSGEAQYELVIRKKLRKGEKPSKNVTAMDFVTEQQVRDWNP